jgi:hypothetical protein
MKTGTQDRKRERHINTERKIDTKHLSMPVMFKLCIACAVGKETCAEQY